MRFVRCISTSLNLSNYKITFLNRLEASYSAVFSLALRCTQSNMKTHEYVFCFHAEFLALHNLLPFTSDEQPVLHLKPEIRFGSHNFLKLIYTAPSCRNFRGAVSSQRRPKPSPVLIAPTHGGMARLSEPG